MPLALPHPILNTQPQPQHQPRLIQDSPLTYQHQQDFAAAVGRVLPDIYSGSPEACSCVCLEDLS